MLERADVDLKGGPESEFVLRFAVLRPASVKLIYHWRELSLGSQRNVGQQSCRHQDPYLLRT